MKRRMKDAFPPVDLSFERSINLAFEAIRKENNMRNRITVRRVVMLAAVLVLMTTAIGFATGVFQSVFSRMQVEGFAGNPTTDYEKVDILASNQVSSQTVEFSDGVKAEVELGQSYYNGEQLILGWTFKGPDEVEFYEKGDSRFAEIHSTQSVEVIDGIEQISVEDIDIEQRFAVEVVDSIYDKVDQDHWAGMFWYDVWMGDGVWIPDIPSSETSWDGSMIEMDNIRLYSAVERIWNKVGAGQRYYECETPLPDAARNQQTLRIMCKVYMRPTWMCYEGEIGNVQSYIGYGETEMREVYFDIPLNGEYEEKTYQIDATFPNHSASVAIKTTPIYAQIDIANQIPEAWRQAWAKHEGYYMPPLNLDANCVFNYEVWVRSNGEMRMALDLLEDFNGIENLTGQFVLPDGTTEIILRPIYANTGVQTDEEIVIQID